MCNTNNVSVEFFPAHFQVKDLSTGVRLLQGRTRDELYEWPVTSSNTISLFAAPTPKTSLSSWHSRMGHPSSFFCNLLFQLFHYQFHILKINPLVLIVLLIKVISFPFTQTQLPQNSLLNTYTQMSGRLQSFLLINSNTTLSLFITTPDTHGSILLNKNPK